MTHHLVSAEIEVEVDNSVSTLDHAHNQRTAHQFIRYAVQDFSPLITQPEFISACHRITDILDELVTLRNQRVKGKVRSPRSILGGKE